MFREKGRRRRGTVVVLPSSRCAAHTNPLGQPAARPSCLNSQVGRVDGHCGKARPRRGSVLRRDLRQQHNEWGHDERRCLCQSWYIGHSVGAIRRTPASSSFGQCAATPSPPSSARRAAATTQPLEPSGAEGDNRVWLFVNRRQAGVEATRSLRRETRCKNYLNYYCNRFLSS
jgi:hypothetical protein